MEKTKVVGLYAANLYSGGSKTHLKNYLEHSSDNDEISLVLFVHKDLCEELNLCGLDMDICVIPDCFKGRILLWQLFFSRKLFIKHKIDILFVPGGVYVGAFRPYVTMCRNMLLFEKDQQLLYGLISRQKIRLKGLLNKISYYNSKKTIFISRYAEARLSRVFGRKINSTVIHHGIDARFLGTWQFLPLGNEMKIVCNSAIEPYKRYIELVQGLDTFSLKKGISVELIIIGNKSNSSYTNMVHREIAHKQSQQFKVNFLDGLDKAAIIRIYKRSHLFIFPSTCENMPNALIEAQATGMPIMCSTIGASSEFLKDHNLKFNPLNQTNLVQVLEGCFNEYDKVAKAHSINYSIDYKWSKTVENTNKELCVDLME